MRRRRVGVLQLILAAVIGQIALSAVGIAGNRRPAATPVVYLGCTAAALLVVAAAAWFLMRGAWSPLRLELPLGLPWWPAHLRLDALTAFFLLVVNLPAAAASLYGLGYAAHDEEPARVLAFCPLFLAGMTLVLLADDAFAFLVCWEFMSLASWALVLAGHRDPAASRAAFVYIVMAGFGTLCLFLGFGLLAGKAGDYGFAAIRARELTGLAGGIALILVLLGAGSKAGLVPLHVWLPLAHPAAPSHVSALMSGAMTKVALYAIIRVTFDLLGQPDWWWGGVLLVIGSATAVLGVLQATLEEDLKTLLAYSTVENVGIVAIGIGLALAFKANQMTAPAALALAAALFHALNHALFKSMLFLGAGAVLTATGTRALGRLGGLIHRMPVTSVVFLTGAAAIAALPPLNGFVSEWLTFQALLDAPDLPQWWLRVGAATTGAALALAAGLAAACFVRAFGTVFLGRPRSAAAVEAKEVGATMRAAMIALAAGCVLLGVLPATAFGTIGSIADRLAGAAPGATAAQSNWLWLAPEGIEAGSYGGLALLAAITVLASVVSYGIHRLASDKIRRSDAWDCGFPAPAVNEGQPDTQYTPSSFAQPVRRVFASGLMRARESVDMPIPSETRAARFSLSLTDPAWATVFGPVARTASWIGTRANVLQFLTIRQYLSLMFAALVVLLAIVAVAR
jgi:hydrogenase-4 component B